MNFHRVAGWRRDEEAGIDFRAADRQGKGSFWPDACPIIAVNDLRHEAVKKVQRDASSRKYVALNLSIFARVGSRASYPVLKLSEIGRRRIWRLTFHHFQLPSSNRRNLTSLGSISECRMEQKNAAETTELCCRITHKKELYLFDQ